MSDVLEKVYTVLDGIGSFFSMLHDAFSDAVGFVSGGLGTVDSVFATLGGTIGAFCVLVLALGLVLFILGR